MVGLNRASLAPVWRPRPRSVGGHLPREEPQLDAITNGIQYQRGRFDGRGAEMKRRELNRLRKADRGQNRLSADVGGKTNWEEVGSSAPRSCSPGSESAMDLVTSLSQGSLQCRSEPHWQLPPHQFVPGEMVDDLRTAVEVRFMKKRKSPQRPRTPFAKADMAQEALLEADEQEELESRQGGCAESTRQAETPLQQLLRRRESEDDLAARSLVVARRRKHKHSRKDLRPLTPSGGAQFRAASNLANLRWGEEQEDHTESEQESEAEQSPRLERPQSASSPPCSPKVQTSQRPWSAAPHFPRVRPVRVLSEMSADGSPFSVDTSRRGGLRSGFSAQASTAERSSEEKPSSGEVGVAVRSASSQGISGGGGDSILVREDDGIGDADFAPASPGHLGSPAPRPRPFHHPPLEDSPVPLPSLDAPALRATEPVVHRFPPPSAARVARPSPEPQKALSIDSRPSSPSASIPRFGRTTSDFQRSGRSVTFDVPKPGPPPSLEETLSVAALQAAVARSPPASSTDGRGGNKRLPPSPTRVALSSHFLLEGGAAPGVARSASVPTLGGHPQPQSGARGPSHVRPPRARPSSAASAGSPGGLVVRVPSAPHGLPDPFRRFSATTDVSEGRGPERGSARSGQRSGRPSPSVERVVVQEEVIAHAPTKNLRARPAVRPPGWKLVASQDAAEPEPAYFPSKYPRGLKWRSELPQLPTELPIADMLDLCHRQCVMAAAAR
mmetsp:Transcript_60928/g.140832  ORF Transcript_60928/g.140832 Transcript_60928/m.140832 type:complete len:727 (-) Transcript_60928:105-2285(-)